MHNTETTPLTRQLLAGALALGALGGGLAVANLASADAVTPGAPMSAATAGTTASSAAPSAPVGTESASTTASPTPSRPTPPPCIVDESELATIYPGARTEKSSIMGTVYTYYYIKDTLVAQAVNGKAHTAICLKS